LQLQPSSNLARYALALVRSAMGENEQAVADLEELVRTNPNWVEPHVKLASLYFRLRRPADGQRERAIIDQLKSKGTEEKLSVPALEPQ
jgi:thioredoxin-like negative regulator of GroEL